MPCLGVDAPDHLIGASIFLDGAQTLWLRSSGKCS